MMYCSKRMDVLVLLAILISVVSCKKEIVKVGDYIGQFRGVDSGEPGGAYFELDVPMRVTEFTSTYMVFDDSNHFEIKSDSIFGSYKIAGTNYLIDPYLAGTFQIINNSYFFTGRYVAIIEPTLNIEGIFDITKKD